MKLITYLLILLSLAACNSRARQVSGLEGQVLPSFNLFLSDSVTHFNTANIPGGSPIVLFYFGPYCPYSRAEMDDIISNIKSFKKVQFYILTTAQFSDLMGFYNYYHLNKYPNITAGIDYTNFFGPYFKAPGVPYMAIYDSKKKLKEVLLGKSGLGDLKQIAKE